MRTKWSKPSQPKSIKNWRRRTISVHSSMFIIKCPRSPENSKLLIARIEEMWINPKGNQSKSVNNWSRQIISSEIHCFHHKMSTFSQKLKLTEFGKDGLWTDGLITTIIIIIMCHLYSTGRLSWISIVLDLVPLWYSHYMIFLSIPWCYPSTLFSVSLVLFYHLSFLPSAIVVSHLLLLYVQNIDISFFW